MFPWFNTEFAEPLDRERGTPGKINLLALRG